MTREEAIKILQGAIKRPNTKDGYLGQAIDMAIKALEQSFENEIILTNAVSKKEVLDLVRDAGKFSLCAMIEDLPPVIPTTKNDLGVREFEEIVVEYPPEDLCTYPEYKGKPYFGIKYKENEKEIVGYGTYKPQVLSRYLKDYFISTTKNDLPHCQCTDAEIAKSFTEDVEAVKDQLPCGERMDFPSTFDEFAKNYGFRDKEEIYTNGSELIPVFRVKQWLEHISTTKNDLAVDCISRADALRVAKNEYLRGWHNALCKALSEKYSIHCEDGIFSVIQEETITGLGLSMDCALGKDVESFLSTMPPVTPTQCWIPVSEGMPLERNAVLVWSINNIYCAYLEDEKWYIFGSYAWELEEVTAWMPLPKPYEGGNKDDNNNQT